MIIKTARFGWNMLHAVQLREQDVSLLYEDTALAVQLLHAALSTVVNRLIPIPVAMIRINLHQIIFWPGYKVSIYVFSKAVVNEVFRQLAITLNFSTIVVV